VLLKAVTRVEASWETASRPKRSLDAIPSANNLTQIDNVGETR